MTTTEDGHETLLVCTVGGNPEPIVASLTHWRPARVVFVSTNESDPSIEAQIVPLMQAAGQPLSPGCYSSTQVPDGQNFAECAVRMRRIQPQIDSWLGRGEQFRVVVDITGGTKCMSAALAVEARRWRCTFSYVGGAERTKDGVGIVVSGKETVLHHQNPWDAFGFQAIDEAIVLFNQADYGAAARLAQRVLPLLGNQGRKRELNAFKTLAEAYDAWDNFNHDTARSRFADLQKSENDLVGALDRETADELLHKSQRHCSYLTGLLKTDGPSRELVGDLLANARRRGGQSRFDDGVARLYRAIEALAQLRLADSYSVLKTKAVLLQQVPEPLRGEWASRARDGTLMLGLQDSYALLNAYADPLSSTFNAIGFSDREKSPLVSRNQSILAHGFLPVSEVTFRHLWDGAVQLACAVGILDSDLPVFPQVGRGSR